MYACLTEVPEFYAHHRADRDVVLQRPRHPRTGSAGVRDDRAACSTSRTRWAS
ncbi:hypothetical protein [Streptomyces sp. KL116D]|uniref:hypothetical protein n=1 Tax=Streptomyces sp. KL116D TaxID=3045152 RepID=UPI0035574DF1